jgi:proteasome lid subunit RPN8/RPN11
MEYGGRMTMKLSETDDQFSIDIIEVTSLHSEPETIPGADFIQPNDYLFTFHPRFPQVVVSQDALATSVEHAQSNTETEVGGLCVGQVYKRAEDDSILIRVERTIVAQHTVAGDISKGKATLTFTPESWSQLIGQYLASQEQSRLVGWYHTHPGFGVFLSGMDLFIHQNFFPDPWHIAVVIDPIQRHFGVFVRFNKLLCLGLLEFSKDLRTVTHKFSSLPMLMTSLEAEHINDETPTMVEVVGLKLVKNTSAKRT